MKACSGRSETFRTSGGQAASRAAGNRPRNLTGSGLTLVIAQFARMTVGVPSINDGTQSINDGTQSIKDGAQSIIDGSQSISRRTQKTNGGAQSINGRVQSCNFGAHNMNGRAQSLNGETQGFSDEARNTTVGASGVKSTDKSSPCLRAGYCPDGDPDYSAR
jgi:uncharacterized phage infection (PIP) family protein YhgE